MNVVTIENSFSESAIMLTSLVFGVKVAGKFIVKDVVIDVAAFAIVGAVAAGVDLYNKKKGGSEEA